MLFVVSINNKEMAAMVYLSHESAARLSPWPRHGSWWQSQSRFRCSRASPWVSLDGIRDRHRCDGSAVHPCSSPAKWEKQAKICLIGECHVA